MPDQTIFCNQCGSQNAAGATFCSKCGASIAAVAQPLAATTARPVVVPARYGGFLIRFVAALIDGILVQVVVGPLGAVFCGAIGVAGGAPRLAREGKRLGVGVFWGALRFLS